MVKTYKSEYNLNVVEMTVDKRLSDKVERKYITSCQCKAYPCHVCRNRISISLEELGKSEVERMFSEILAA